MTTEEIIRAAADMLGQPNPFANPAQVAEMYKAQAAYKNAYGPRDPSAVSFVKRDGVWELPR